MAKYTITYKCGHQEEVQLFGKYKERERRIAYYATIDCPECRAKKSAEKATEQGLVALTGSDKQVAWANDIRSKVIVDLKTMGEQVAANKDVFDAIVNEIKGETLASWWIDNRHQSATDMVRARMAKYIKG